MSWAVSATIEPGDDPLSRLMDVTARPETFEPGEYEQLEYAAHVAASLVTRAHLGSYGYHDVELAGGTDNGRGWTSIKVAAIAPPPAPPDD